MKRITILLLCFCLCLVSPTYLFAEPTQNTPQQTEGQESPPAETPKNVRDQNILVPTAKGVQKATLDEANKIKKYEAQSSDQLCASYLLGDYESGEILEAYNIDSIRAMASTSKLVSIFVVLDKLQDGTISKDDMVTIDHQSASLSGSSFKLKENMQVSVDDLILASLVVSGNDAVTALAKHISGSVEEFVHLMNVKCKDLGLKNAHMVNPTGLTDYAINDYNKMTTREMFLLSCELLRKHPEILSYTSTPLLKDDSRNFIEYNTNPILGIVPQIDGLKTGYTNAAGRCVIATGLKKGVENQTKNLRLVGVITGCTGDWQRYVVAKRLMSEGFDKYSYQALGNPQKPCSKIEVENAAEQEIPIYETQQAYTLWNGTDEIHPDITLKEHLKAPLAAGTVVGQIHYIMNGNEIHSSDLVVKEKVHEKGILSRIVRIYEDIFKHIDEAA